MRRALVYISIFFGSAFLIACATNKQNDDENTQSKMEEQMNTMPVDTSTEDDQNTIQVMFYNGIMNQQANDVIDYTNHLYYFLDEEEVEDDTLYAYYVLVYHESDQYQVLEREETESKDHYDARVNKCKAELVAKHMKSMGLIVLEDYPYSFLKNGYLGNDHLLMGYCTVAGTMTQLKTLFDETEAYDTGFYILSPASRPDIMEYIEASGWNAESEYDPISWYNSHRDEIHEMIGMKRYIKLSAEQSISEQ